MSKICLALVLLICSWVANAVPCDPAFGPGGGACPPPAGPTEVIPANPDWFPQIYTGVDQYYAVFESLYRVKVGDRDTFLVLIYKLPSGYPIGVMVGPCMVGICGNLWSKALMEMYVKLDAPLRYRYFMGSSAAP